MGTAHAAGSGGLFGGHINSEDLFKQGTGLGGKFDAQLNNLGSIFLMVFKAIVVIMTAVAAMMVGFGLAEGKKELWNWLLGACIAVNVGWFLQSFGFLDYWYNALPGAGGGLPTFEINAPDNVNDMTFMDSFMSTYIEGIIKPGAKAILPYCVRLLLILTILEVGWEFSFKLIAGDKVQYMLSILVKVGLFILIMQNWIDLMDALADGFIQIGMKAAGTETKISLDDAYKIFYQLFVSFLPTELSAWDVVKSFVTGGAQKLAGEILILIVLAIIIVICGILISIEIFMAKIEFYTMALISMPLLPFHVTSKFSFLSDKAIGAMFNLAIKLSCVTFISEITWPFLRSYNEKFVSTPPSEFGSVMLNAFQVVLAGLTILLITKKVPELVTGLLSGQPQLGGAGMVDMATGAAKTAVGGAGQAQAAYAMSKGGVGAGGALNKSLMGLATKAGLAAVPGVGIAAAAAGTLANLAVSSAKSTAGVNEYRSGIDKVGQMVNPGAYNDGVGSDRKLETAAKLVDNDTPDNAPPSRPQYSSPAEEAVLKNHNNQFGGINDVGTGKGDAKESADSGSKQSNAGGDKSKTAELAENSPMGGAGKK
ncbi:MAG: type IV secretion system protein [Schwartzia sp.]|nr:type IV secretion system protein [Schwartzia sp. (in: firmicutes)]